MSITQGGVAHLATFPGNLDLSQTLSVQLALMSAPFLGILGHRLSPVQCGEYR